MTDDHDPDDLTAEDLERLARSLSLDGSLGRQDALRVVALLREAAARRRHPSRG